MVSLNAIGEPSVENSYKKLGQQGEDIARRIIAHRLKMKILEQNYRTRMGEIDIIAQDKNSLVFVEVKSRVVLNAGLPEESVTPAKQEKIRRVALYYLICHGYNPHHVTFRFDVISITFPAGILSRPNIRYLKNAF